MRFYGTLSYDQKNRTWKLAGDPHVVSRAKRVFPRISKMEFGVISVAHSDEVARDLEWFMVRYPLKIAPRTRGFLRKASVAHQDAVATLDELLGGKYASRSFRLALPPRDYQKLAAELYLRKGYLLLADELGLGKSVVAIASFTDQRTLPALVVSVAGYMPRQWAKMIEKFAPGLFVHIVGKKEPYELPKRNGRSPDVLITTYHKLDSWSQVFGKYCQSAVFDEIQELRRSESLKYGGAREVARHVPFRIGLSATPVYNYGGEIFNVYEVLSEGCLGPLAEFEREWCNVGYRASTLRDPQAFGAWLAENHMILRRTRKEVGRELPALTRIPHDVDFDMDPIDRVEDRATELAKIILDRDRAELYQGELIQAQSELSNTLRQATGIAKAKYVAEFVRLLLESDETVLVYAWHRAVYDILKARLQEYDPAFFTGHETPAQKEKAFERVVEGSTNLLFMSLRSGAGLDGLQSVCRTVVFAELDWSWGVLEQCIGRVFRDGQADPVAAYFMVSEGGADPIIAEILGIKREQVDGIRDPRRREERNALLGADSRHAAKLAQYYLDKIARKRRKKRGVEENSKQAI